MKIIRIAAVLAALTLAAHGQKVSSLTAITGAAVDPAADLLNIVDTSAGTAGSKKITIAELVNVSSFTNGNFLAANSVEFSQVNGLTAALAAKAADDAALTALAGGSDFVQFSGPASTVKVFTLPNANTTLADDSAVVHLTGNETIAGNKTFTGNVVSSLNFSTTSGDFTTSNGGINATSGTVSGNTVVSPNLSVQSTGSAFRTIFSTSEATTANRTISLNVGNSSRTLTLSGNPTLNDWFDQSVKSGTSPTFTGTNITALNGSNISTGTVPLARLSGITTSQTSGIAASATVAEFSYSSTTSGLGITGASGAWSWTLPTGATALEIVAVAGGGGGGSGRRGATSTNRGGGGGGAAGGLTRISIPVSALPSTTLALNVGLGGAGGTAITTDDTNGNNGSLGADTTITSSGSYVCRSYAPAGAGGGGSTSGGGAGSAWSVGGTEIGGAGGLGGASGASTVGTGGPVSPGGGGGGGGVTSANVFGAGADPGVSGGLVWGGVSNSIRGYDDGSNRSATNATLAMAWSPVGGGGGGGSGSVANPGGTGGAGIRGAGGGGGGGSINGQASGAGGKGGDGFIRIIVRY